MRRHEADAALETLRDWLIENQAYDGYGNDERLQQWLQAIDFALVDMWEDA
jgi:hypothetical protein